MVQVTYHRALERCRGCENYTLNKPQKRRPINIQHLSHYKRRSCGMRSRCRIFFQSGLRILNTPIAFF